MKWLKSLLKRKYDYTPLITISIDKNSILHNIKQFLSISPNGHIIPVLKSNAYGHGLREIAHIIEEFNNTHNSSLPFIAIDSYFEALALRSASIKTPILIIGYTRSEDILKSRLKNINYTITSLDQLKDLSSLLPHYKRKDINIQIKIADIRINSPMRIVLFICHNNILIIIL